MRRGLQEASAEESLAGLDERRHRLAQALSAPSSAPLSTLTRSAGQSAPPMYWYQKNPIKTGSFSRKQGPPETWVYCLQAF